MISRRLVRIKTLQALYAARQSGESSLNENLRHLEDALNSPHEVILFLLEFPQQLHEYLLSEAEAEKSKYYPDNNKIREYLVFENNTLITRIYNAVLQQKRKLFSAEWSDYADLFGKLFSELKQQEFFTDYLVFDHHNDSQEKEFLIAFFEYFILGSEIFHHLMEETGNSWNDDEPFVLRELLKIIENISPEKPVSLPARLDKDDEDLQFGLKMFNIVSVSNDEMEKDIEAVTDNWDPGRIALLDMLCIKMAISEFLNFPLIPVKVTINEYLDISREYSTPGSSRFLNGILDKIRIMMEKSGRIQKSGRGLRDR